MKIVGFLIILIGIVVFPSKVNSQVINGDFANGTASWSWSQSSGPLPGECLPLQSFTPVLNTDTPLPNLSQNYGRSAKIAAPVQDYSSNNLWRCKKIEQEVFIPIGANLLFDFWSNAGDKSFNGNYYSSSNLGIPILGITLSDTASSLVRSYSIDTSDGCSPFVSCNNYVASGIKIDSALWGKRVKLSISTSIYRTLNFDFATVFIDNIRLEKPPIFSLVPKSGAWYNSSRSGHGLHLSKASDGRIVMMWYTYLSNGKPIWYISDTLPVINGVYASKIYKNTWNYTTQTSTKVPVGDIKLEMHSSTSSTFSWDLYSISGDNVGFDGGEPMEYLFGGESYTGLWYEPALSGYGYSIDYKNNTGGIDTSATVFYYVNGEPVWAAGQKEGAPTLNNIVPLKAINGVGLCPECNGQTIVKTASAVGEVGFSLDTNKSWVYLQDLNGAPVWQRGLPAQPVDTFRLTYP